MPKGKWEAFEVAHRISGLWPEQRLAAALLVEAIDDCRDGDSGACEWLRRKGAWWLDILASGMDEGEVDVYYDVLATAGATTSEGA